MNKLKMIEKDSYIVDRSLWTDDLCDNLRMEFDPQYKYQPNLGLIEQRLAYILLNQEAFTKKHMADVSDAIGEASIVMVRVLLIRAFKRIEDLNNEKVKEINNEV